MAKRAHIVFFGDVDGTGYRFFLQQKAVDLGLKGFIQKTEDGKIEVDIEGKPNSVDEFISFIGKGVSLQSESNSFKVEIFETIIGYTTLKSELV
ncbi:acylphosphatase [Solibacillus sp. FSL H8-0538]|uniref:acylphosphatase n=1 Tax=Solibacillus sp. FSL H8-0538 TaxID=2921400 RepID=UPI0030F7B4D7